MANRVEKGRRGEAVACEHLRQEGWEVVTTNFECEFGEIDVVARRELVDEQAWLVAFVEVKSRRDASEVAPQLSVTARKRRTIARVAKYYAQYHGGPGEGYRFDVIGVDLGSEPPTVEHFEGAFDARGRPY